MNLGFSSCYRPVSCRPGGQVQMDDKARLITVHFSNVMLVNAGRVRVLFYLLKNLRKMEKHGGNYAVIPAVVRHDNNLTFFQRILFAEISAQLNYEGCCYASDADLAYFLKVEEGIVSGGIKALHEAGYIGIGMKFEKDRFIYATAKAQLP